LEDAVPSGKLVKQGEVRRRAIVKFIREYVRVNHKSPTVSEIATGVGLSSKASAKGHLDRLHQDGVIRMTPGSHRSVSVVED
jgi:SOS-response transcriptional repressor LexA